MHLNFNIMKRYILPLLTLAGISFLSCERIIPFESDDVNPLITLYSTLQPDSSVEAFVSRSIGILDQSEPILINSAQVWAEDSNGNFLDSLTFIGLGIYRSTNLSGIEGGKYEIHAAYENLPSVYGSATIPNIPAEGAVDSLDAVEGNFGGPGPSSQPYLSYSFEIIDDGEPGYYFIEAYERLRGTTTIPNYPLEIETDDPYVTGSGFGLNQYKQRVEISNELFLGGSHVLNFRIYQWDFNGMEVLFKLKKVDDATFFYERSLDQYKRANGNPFTQPVSVYSNVTDGLGVVSAEAFRWILP